MVVLEPLKPSAEPQAMTIRARRTVTLNDILVGDVWICSGQSNMGRAGNLLNHYRVKGPIEYAKVTRYFERVGPGQGSPAMSNLGDLLRRLQVPGSQRKALDQPDVLPALLHLYAIGYRNYFLYGIWRWVTLENHLPALHKETRRLEREIRRLRSEKPESWEDLSTRYADAIAGLKEVIASAVAVTALNVVPRHVLGAPGKPSANDKLNIGCVGVGGMQGAGDVRRVSSQNIYALCDVDQRHLDKTAAHYPSAKKYRDFREMLDKEHKTLDAITVTIPDHMHATVSLWAMERGLGVYCQKPLTQTVWEARLLAKAARKYKVATQMGNQGYSCEATRVACEIIFNGDLGDIKV